MGIVLNIFREHTRTTHLADVDVTPEMGYQRTAQGMFGDDQANFTIYGGAAWLRDLSANWLGGWLFERDGGAEALTGFVGQIHTMRLYVYGRVYAVSLGDLFNRVTVGYTTSWGGSVSYQSADNTGSQDTYGLRFLRADATAPTASASAAALAAELAADLGSPRPYLADVYPPEQGNRLEITVLGSAHVLEAEYINTASSGTYDVATAIRAVFLQSAVIDEGDGEATLSRDIANAVYYTSLWDRLQQCFNLLGKTWRGGCYGRPVFDYYQLDQDAPRYYLEIDEDGRRTFYDTEGGSIVPDSMVRPGQYVKMPDIGLGGLPDTILLDGLTYSLDGLRFSTALEDRLAVLAGELIIGP